MKSFDQILEEGKEKASDPKSHTTLWKERINTIMDSLHKLNDMYGNDEVHSVKVEAKNCKKCNKASFVVAVRDIDNIKRIIRFHKIRWTTIERGTYYCETCKKDI